MRIKNTSIPTFLSKYGAKTNPKELQSDDKYLNNYFVSTDLKIEYLEIIFTKSPFYKQKVKSILYKIVEYDDMFNKLEEVQIKLAD